MKIIEKNIKDALDIMGYQNLTTIQKHVIPLLLENKNIIAKAMTGSGKTASYLIPVIQNINWNENKPQALILTCTRELCKQVENEAKNIGKLKKIKVTSIHGKAKMEYQANMLKQKCHIVCATPGRLLDHLNNTSIDLSNIHYLIIDEADYMLDMGFIDDVERILNYLNKDITIGLFSATYPDRILNLINTYIKEYQIIETDSKAKINNYYIDTDNKYDSLLKILRLKNIESCLIFVEMQRDADELTNKLIKEKINVSIIHGGLEQNERFKQLELFKSGKRRIMIATDVAARGIDIEKVSHVIHYHLPHTIEDYIHRCGRSGRVNETGISILLNNDFNDLTNQIIHTFNLKELELNDLYDNYDYLNTIADKTNKEDKWNKTIEKIYINAGKDKKIRVIDIIGALCSLENITNDDIGVIEVLSKMSYVEIFNNKASYIINEFKHKTIKNKKVKIEYAK